MCALRNRLWKFFCSVLTSKFYAMKLHLLYHLLNEARRPADIFPMNASVYEQFNVHIRNAYRGLSRRRGARMQETVCLIERQQRGA